MPQRVLVIDVAERKEFAVPNEATPASVWAAVHPLFWRREPNDRSAFISATSITKTRQAHQITACSLYKLKKLAYSIYLEELVDPNKMKYFEDWCELRKQESPQFQYWSTVLSTELVVLLFVRSLRESNFTLYRQALCQLIPYLFSNNNVHYAQWLRSTW